VYHLQDDRQHAWIKTCMGGSNTLWDYLILILQLRYNRLREQMVRKAKTGSIQVAHAIYLCINAGQLEGLRELLASDDFRPIFPEFNIMITLGIVSRFLGRIISMFRCCGDRLSRYSYFHVEANTSISAA